MKFGSFCAAIGCLMIGAAATAQVSDTKIQPSSRRIDPKTIPSRTISDNLTPDQQQKALAKSLVKQNDATVHEVFSVHVMHPPKTGPQPRTETTPGNGSVSYYNSAVLTNPIVIPVFWGFQANQGVPAAAADGLVPYLMNFLDGLAGSSWLETTSQYYENTPQQVIQSATLLVANPVFDDSSSPGANYTNSDVQNEVGKLVGPQIVKNSNDIIIVVTPHNSVNTDLQSGGDCAEHFSSQGLNFFTMVHNDTIVSLPYIPIYPISVAAQIRSRACSMASAL